MIHAITCDHPSFKNVAFEPGMNVVLADRTKESTKKDSRNGLGKTTLVQVMHFCLGGTRLGTLAAKELKDWTFTLDLTLAGKRVKVSRNTEHSGHVRVEGDTAGWPVQPSTQRASEKTLLIKEWNLLLGALMFGLPAHPYDMTYHPTFRSLISYFIRRDRDAFSSPFEHFRKQREWEKQVANAFLLGLAWEDASEWQRLKDKKKVVDSLKEAGELGVISEIVGSLGELEATKVRLEAQSQREERELTTFEVHPQYREIEARANKLTEEIHRSANDNVTDSRLRDFYKKGLEEEHEPARNDVARLYESAGLTLPGLVRRHLDEIEVFHRKIIENRRHFLSSEIERLGRAIADRDDAIGRRTHERAELMKVLQTTRALDEYTKLQQLHLETVARVRDVEARIARIKEFDEGASSLRIELELLHQRARRDYDERRAQRERAIALFNANSEALYNRPGNLVIDVTDTGFKFDVEIERSDSQGISSMKVFCYDLMLAQLWATDNPSPRLLVHDSTLFADVDGRQVALALERAAEQSKKCGFQYICLLNSDTTPWTEFSKGFDLNAHVRLRLTDARTDGGLLGIRF